ncbi:3-deoxy-D-manno-octulosonic acid transferase [Paracoccus gahaiensis]|uniref:3-deoxy-D-manno-octulosonic acid transferase n=1 Tax=Paracoccus gahaiensis TaxID=1706839 RepID=A0A4U0R641_9RHOB|nr:glycosyltransferase N-terminal domain-containing protein [Paracoccus gahaiensis]TJZ90453.1 3-deoxy-D-manno-octulosonic acid transferase [Paracoccus gahaiensis]
MSGPGLGQLGLGQLGLWLHLRNRRGQTPGLPPLPPGNGPVLILHVAADALAAAPQILHRLTRARPLLRLVRLGAEEAGGDDPADDPVLVAQLLDQAKPGAVLLLGATLPAALIAAATARRIPVLLAEFRMSARDLAWGLQGGMRRQLLTQLASVMVTDADSLAQARRISLPAARMAMTGPVSEIREPLHCSETERVSMAQQMNGRHAWFAASLPAPEEAVVLDAHQAALRRSHRALLILAPRDPARIDGLARDIEAGGLSVARRSEDEDFGDEIQVLLTDGPTEMGLWYRLAPVSFMGGTLCGDEAAMRHPFEPAALGSAIVHGPEAGAFRTEWQQLDGAQAARQVRGPEDLCQAIADLTQPVPIATLASNAWTVSTGGADVAIRIAERVLAAIDAPRPAGPARESLPA